MRAVECISITSVVTNYFDCMVIMFSCTFCLCGLYDTTSVKFYHQVSTDIKMTKSVIS